jgi:hypothetical protein
MRDMNTTHSNMTFACVMLQIKGDNANNDYHYLEFCKQIIIDKEFILNFCSQKFAVIKQASNKLNYFV